MQIIINAQKNELNRIGQFEEDYRSYLNALEIPLSVMQKLKTISPRLVDNLRAYYQGSNQPTFCYVKLYNELFSTIEENIETVIHRQKTELLQELISIKARRNFVKYSQDNKEHSLLIKDAKAHSTPEYEERIKQELQELKAFISSMYRNKPEF